MCNYLQYFIYNITKNIIIYDEWLQLHVCSNDILQVWCVLHNYYYYMAVHVVCVGTGSYSLSFEATCNKLMILITAQRYGVRTWLWDGVLVDNRYSKSAGEWDSAMVYLLKDL